MGVLDDMDADAENDPENEEELDDELLWGNSDGDAETAEDLELRFDLCCSK